MDKSQKNFSVGSLKRGAHGVYFGFGLACEVKNPETGLLEKYYDRQNEHIPESVMISAAKRFMTGQRSAKVMHRGAPVGDVRFAMPVTRDTAKAMTGFTGEIEKTGLYIGIVPHAEHIEGFEEGFAKGEGLSLGGRGSRVAAGKKSVEKAADPYQQEGERYDYDDLELDEFSRVDVPAMAPALLDVSKNAEDKLEVSVGGENFGELSQDSIKTVLEHIENIIQNGQGINNNDSSQSTKETLEMSKEKTEAKKEEITQEAVDKAVTEAALKSLSAEQKEFYDAADDASKSAFLEKDFAGRQELVDAEKANRHVVYTDASGKRWFESDDAEKIELVKRLDAVEKREKEVEEKAKMDAIKAQVNTTYKSLPGMDDEKTAILKAIEGIPNDKHREAAHRILKVASSKLGTMTGMVGTEMAPDVDLDGVSRKEANHRLMEETRKYVDEGLTKSEARSRVMRENKELFRLANSPVN